VAIAPHKSHYTPNKGFTLIETLVTSLILSIGLLGIASLQSLALSGSLDSGQRGKAVWLDQDLLERVRTNLGGAVMRHGLVQTLGGENGIHSQIRRDYTTQTACSVSPAKYCSDWASESGQKINGEFCAPAELVAFDLWEVACGYSYSERVVQHDPDRVKTNIVDFMGESSVTLECNDSNTTDADSCSRHSDFVITTRWNGQGEGIREQQLQFTARP
jgi:type IV pilus assembly protein PilV